MHDSDSLTLALIQHACGDDAQTNLDTSLDGIAAAAAHGAQLVVLPELHRSRYFCRREDPQAFDLADPLDGPTAQSLAGAARRHGVVVVGSIFERRAPGLFHNTALVFDRDGRRAGIYRKMHIPHDPAYYEKYYFTPGEQGFTPIDTSLGRLGVLVCWDQWYPEAARLMALAGAQLLVYPSAIGWDPADTPAERDRQLAAWQLVQRGHAIANHLPVAACNRVGTEGDDDTQIAFWGHSFICGPQGEMLAEADDNADVILATIQRARTAELRRDWPFLRDRRIDAYAGLNRRFLDE